jgi:hypothetical protein
MPSKSKAPASLSEAPPREWSVVLALLDRSQDERAFWQYVLVSSQAAGASAEVKGGTAREHRQESPACRALRHAAVGNQSTLLGAGAAGSST